jgi:hypothetical protein
MAETAVSEKTPKSPDSKQERERSTIDFPYVSLDDAISVAKTVYKLGGNQCRLDSLAADLGHETVISGGFRQKLSAAHTFGFTTLSQGLVSLTNLGSRVVDSEQERAARVEAFLKVPLYSAIYEEFKNGALPPAEGLEAKMVSLGVSNKMKGRARQVFQRSAKEAGFFAYGTTKLIYPALGVALPKPKELGEQIAESKGGTGNGGDGGSGNGKKRHPFIEGLLETLPPAALGVPKGEWSLKDRQDWLQTAAGIFNLIYRSGEDDQDGSAVSVSITTAKTSAN